MATSRWTALLGQVGVAVLRCEHLRLSKALKIAPSTVHCYCCREDSIGVLPRPLLANFVGRLHGWNSILHSHLLGGRVAALFLTCAAMLGCVLGR